MFDARRLEEMTLASLLEKYPFVDSFFAGQDIELSQLAPDRTIAALFAERETQADEDEAGEAGRLMRQLGEYIAQMLSFLGEGQDRIGSLTIQPGTDKSGRPEGFEAIRLVPGDTVCIVGPTGSGKSRLLADIEWIAQADTPTGRRVLIDDRTPDEKWRFSPTHKLVAQLSQNMNFVMDLTVGEFLELHAESRLVSDRANVVERILVAANELAGEAFEVGTPITSLSGGQSRALMIADTAILSRSPIVLIDEIENAGIDRRKALSLLLSEEKIVLMATHDPLLALMGGTRLVIRNGGIAQVIRTSAREREILGELERIDHRMMDLRQQLRVGESLH